MKYLIVIEKTRAGYSAYSTDIPGCVATGETRSDVEQGIREAIEFHLEGLKAEGANLPPPESYSTYLDVSA